MLVSRRRSRRPPCAAAATEIHWSSAFLVTRPGMRIKSWHAAGTSGKWIHCLHPSSVLGSQSHGLHGLHGLAADIRVDRRATLQSRPGRQRATLKRHARIISGVHAGTWRAACHESPSAQKRARHRLIHCMASRCQDSAVRQTARNWCVWEHSQYRGAGPREQPAPCDKSGQGTCGDGGPTSRCVQ